MPNLLFTAQESIAGVTAHRPQLGVYAGVLLLTAQLTKVDFIYHVMEYCPKSLVFWKGESSALAILLKAEGEPLFLSEDPNTCCPVESGRGTPHHSFHPWLQILLLILTQ